MLKCKCGSDLFQETSAIKLDSGAFRIWSTKEKLVPTKRSIPLLTCMLCDRLHVPATSMFGKNALDPEVQMMKEIMELAEIRNTRIEYLEEDLPKQMPLITNKISNLECMVSALIRTPSDPAAKEEDVTPEEALDVKATNANKGNSKKPVR